MKADKGDSDRRKSIYSLDWKYIVYRLKNPDSDLDEILEGLGLSTWAGKHVLLKDFAVIDSDDSLMNLVRRNWDKTPDPHQVIATIGSPEDELTIEF